MPNANGATQQTGCCITNFAFEQFQDFFCECPTSLPGNTVKQIKTQDAPSQPKEAIFDNGETHVIIAID